MADKQKKEECFEGDLALLKRWQVFLIVVGLVMAPVTSYYTSSASMNDKIAKIELKAAENYVRKDDIGEMKKKLDKMAEDISEIKGYLSRKQR